MSTEKVSPLARRVAANWLKERGIKVALEAVPMAAPADGGGGDQTAIPKSGPGKAVMADQLDALKDLLEKGDHGGFKAGLENLNNLFERSSHTTEG